MGPARVQPFIRIKTGFMKMFRKVGKSRVLVVLRRETHQNDRPGPYFSKITKSTRYFANSATSGRKYESSIMAGISGQDGFGALKHFFGGARRSNKPIWKAGIAKFSLFAQILGFRHIKILHFPEYGFWT